MITYGFFNAVDNDRTYDAATFNTFFEGLIAKNGVFADVDDGFEVTPLTGLNVKVGKGKAIVNNHWVRSNSDEAVTLNTAHSVLSRYDMIALTWNATSRIIELTVTAGTPASNPIKPSPKRTESISEIALAYVYVAAGATSLSYSNVTDSRHDTSVCGIITGLIKQIDISTLYAQYATKFEELTAAMQTWQNEQKNAFDSWMSTLTEQLNVNTYIELKQASINGSGIQWYIDLPEELEYSPNDILNVYIDGVLCIENVDYIIQENEVVGGMMLKFFEKINAAEDERMTITFQCYKSKIGVNV